MATIKDLEKKIDRLEKELKSYKEDIKSSEAELRDLDVTIAQNKALGERNEMIQNAHKALKALENQRQMAVGSRERLNDLEAVGINNLRQEEVEELKRLQRMVEHDEGIQKKIDKYSELTAGVKEMSEEEEAAFNKGKAGFSDLALKIGLNSRAANKFVNSITEMSEMAKSEDGLKGVKKAFADVFSVQRMGLAVFAQVVAASVELALATERASAAFAANTGAGRIVSEQIQNVARNFRNVGLDAAGAGEAMQSLFNNFTGFTQMGPKAQESLAATVASLKRLGIDGTTATQALTLFNMNMGESIKNSENLTKKLAMMGTQIGISSSKMLKGFVEASKSLAVYGKGAVKVFSDLAAQAKAANVETSTLLGIADQFDTFAGAADATGKLNSILGTQLSTTDLLAMKENERIETLIRSMQMQGRSFKDMDRFSQKAVAAAVNISDLAEAQRIFGMSVSEYRKGLRPDPKEEAFQNALKDTLTVMEKLKRIGQEFAIALTPFLNTIGDIAQSILDFNDFTGGYLIPTIAGIVTAFVVLPKILGIVGALFTGLSFAAPVAGTGLLIFAAGLGALALGLALLDTDALIALGSIFGGGEVVEAKMSFMNDAQDFTKELAKNKATLKPMLGDLALIATGQTTQDVTMATVGYNFNTFAAKFENNFKPEVTVKIGNEEFKDFVLETQAEGTK